jgi:hypothetical protein
MMEISNCPLIDRRSKNSISDFRDVMTSMLVLWLWEGSFVLFMAGSFIQGAMNKGEYTILSLERVT